MPGIQKETKSSKSLGTDKSRILVVDDHPLIRSGLSALIGAEPDLEICGEAGTVDGALDLAARIVPDLAIVDISLADHGDGLDLVKRLHVRDPGLKILVFSVYDEILFAQRALAAGAKGYLNKKEATASIVYAIRRILAGDYFVSDRLAQSTIRQLSESGAGPGDPLTSLSDRELQIYRLVGTGRGTSQIATQLHLSVKTIESHKSRIKKKLNLASASELLRDAMEWSSRKV
ncbi:MAG: response regulator [Gammaproteobacteria bacterium]